MKKISLIVTSLVFCIAAVFIFPAKEANANPLAVGGALYLGGAGIYVVGTLGVAAVAGLVELDSCSSCQDDLEAHAHQTWATVTGQAKTGMQAMVDGAVGVGVGLTAVDASVNSWIDGQIQNIAANAFKSANQLNFEGVVPYTGSGTAYMVALNDAQRASGLVLLVNGREAELISIKANADGLYRQVQFVDGVGDIGEWFFPGGYAAVQGALSSVTNLDQLLAHAGTYFGIGAIAANGTSTVDKMMYAQMSANAVEAWEEMTDAGLVLPVDNARPLAGDIPLTYDPVTDAYSGIDGVNVPREDITGYDYGKPSWRTLEDLSMLGLSGLGAGLYIDGWATADSITSTYDPATDITTTTTSGTTTNVTTGETAVTSTTTTTTGDTTGNPPVDVPPTTAPKTGEPLNPFKAKPMPIAALTGLFQLLAALIFYLIRLFTFIATLALIAPTPIDNPYFIWFTTATFQGITPYPLVQNLALFFLGFSVYRSVRRVFG